MKLKRLLFAVPLFLLAFLLQFQPSAVSAQEGPPGPLHEGAPFGQRLDMVRMIKLIDALGLNEEQAAKMAIIFKKHREKMAPTWAKLKEARVNLEKLLKATPQGKKVDELIVIYRETFKALGQLREENVNEILNMLNPEQKAKFILFEERFPREVRDNMREMRQHRMEKMEGILKEEGKTKREPSKGDKDGSD